MDNDEMIIKNKYYIKTWYIMLIQIDLYGSYAIMHAIYTHTNIVVHNNMKYTRKLLHR